MQEFIKTKKSVLHVKIIMSIVQIWRNLTNLDNNKIFTQTIIKWNIFDVKTDLILLIFSEISKIIQINFYKS